MQNNDENKTQDVAVDSDDEDQSYEEFTVNSDDEVSNPNTNLSTADCDDDELSRTKKTTTSNGNDENPDCGTKKPVAKNESYAWPMYRASTSREKLLATPEDDYGCEHYKRKSKFVTPCCNKVYTCRFCHDEQEAHTVNRKEVTELICVLCDTRQPVQATCQNCHCQFGKYTCLECNLFDDEDKNQYHCDGCGICRVGGREKFFHCAKCNMCLPVQLQNGHTCIENVSHSNCPVCLEDIHTSRTPCHIPGCGHLLHRTCFKELLQSGHYACPTCQVSLLDMTDLWKYLDTEVSLTPMPEEYKDYKADILCKDCHEESTVKFHIVGLKCLNCGSYNTCRIKGSPSPVCTDPDVLSEAAAGGSNKEEKEQSEG
ncbi:RING finger and CHY zinc finger domain-containing protein 1 isoform X1 [Camponotus floridanus]|uniref:RING finger and CHY zinc finger domain-containing protein 1 isoform X1 n=1 Tax=Camponotus floridanus TaxID=104421 RepID=UPI00059DFDCB|nr:RING finger and CHY zinc finger domain-containing protein 1 isoform X1 [Camponotus floridanus]